ncbi:MULTISPECIES: histidine phosphatase family protein [Cyanophyceae]|uniref:histidine phosphatase family protein n=1 Tax=Cyanophyceae TaxID=3028117 RepID=UPI0002FD6707|nr:MULTISPECIES: histidine phosphatase family protein [Cyanophyceae]SMH34315.1 Broad specificity phosphatase PhoE [Picosynechococcus sp. OG1]SMQ84581.1 Broad specificity phosphatase PhoE [Synechococcus sp. 7002]
MLFKPVSHSAWGRKLWFVRHGNRLDFVQPAWFTTALYPYDPPLCPAGHHQAQELGDRLAPETIHHIFTSPFLRTIQTSYYCAQRLNLPLKLEPGLGEWQNPHWMTRPPLTHPKAFLRQNFIHIDWRYQEKYLPDYPENAAQVQRRTIKTLKQLLKSYSGNLLLIGHKIPLGICLNYLLGTDQTISPDVCALNQLVNLGDRWLWQRQNETDFLTDPGIKVAP